jgi:hypothetical protein
MTTPEEKCKAEVHRLKAENHLKAAAILEGKEPTKTAATPIPPAPTKHARGKSPEEIQAFVAAAGRRNRGL